MPITRAATLAMSDEADDTSGRPRTSRFREHTNTTNSIHPPPEDLWKDLGIEQLIDQFNEENAKPPVSRKSSGNHVPKTTKPALSRAASDTAVPNGFGTPAVSGPGPSSSAQPVTPAASEGTFGRFQRAFASMVGSVLGKRKAGNTDAEREKQVMDDRKKAAEAAYHEAKELGLLPTPKVFVRPALAAKSHNCVAHTATPARAPRTPTLYHTPSKKDLNKQKKLSKRVSDLEFKLASARKELHTVLHSDLPPVPPLPTILPPTPSLSQSENDSASQMDVTPAPEPQVRIGKIVKKRKATTHNEDGEYKPIPTDSEGDIDLISAASASEAEESQPTRAIKRVKSSASKKNLKRQSSRLQKKLSRGTLRTERREEIAVTVVPDGVSVPEVPSIPESMEGKGKRVKLREGNDGYGGLEHEMF